MKYRIHHTRIRGFSTYTPEYKKHWFSSWQPCFYFWKFSQFKCAIGYDSIEEAVDKIKWEFKPDINEYIDVTKDIL